MNKKRIIQFTQKNTSLFANFVNLGFIQASNILIQLILFPIIIRLVGIESFGYVIVATSIASFIGLFINYGTNLSGIKDIAINKSNKSILETLFYNIYYTRITLFIVASVLPIILFIFEYKQIKYLLFSTPIILAELINPLFYFNGIEKLTIYNLGNFLGKLCSFALIILFINPLTPAWMVNFYMGIGNFIFFGLLMLYAIQKNKLIPPAFNIQHILHIIKTNFFLVCNNLTVHLQQSLFLILLPLVSTPIVVGAYSLADKLISSFRILLVAFSSALYPKAAIMYENQKEYWTNFKIKMNKLLFYSFLLITIVIYLFNESIVHLLAGQQNDSAALYIRSIALAPLFAAMNSMNTIELLIRNQYQFIFLNSLCLLVFVLISTSFFIYINQSELFGYYLVIVELASIPISLYFLRKSSANIISPSSPSSN